MKVTEFRLQGALGMEFLTANIFSYSLSYSLPEGMDRNILPLQREKTIFIEVQVSLTGSEKSNPVPEGLLSKLPL